MERVISEVQRCSAVLQFTVLEYQWVGERKGSLVECQGLSHRFSDGKYIKSEWVGWYGATCRMPEWLGSQVLEVVGIEVVLPVESTSHVACRFSVPYSLIKSMCILLPWLCSPFSKFTFLSGLDFLLLILIDSFIFRIFECFFFLCTYFFVVIFVNVFALLNYFIKFLRILYNVP